MLTTAVVSISVVQNSLLCDRKLEELKKAKISIIPSITPEISNLLNTFLWEHSSKINFKSGSIYCHLSWFLWPSYNFCFCCYFLYIMEIVTKTIYDTAPDGIGIWTNKTKHTKDCMRTEFIWIFLWKGARYIQCHLTWPWYWISTMATQVLSLHVWYKATPISWN